MIARRAHGSAAVQILVGLSILLLLPGSAHASLLSEEAEDKLATFIALFVLFVVPAVLIALFWMVHILPEKIAHKRHHPQFEAIRTLCLLSLVFGGLLWPLAWLWAYSKPVMYKMAYGTDKHPDAHKDEYPGEEAPRETALPAAGLGLSSPASLRERLARLEDKLPPSELTTLRADIDALEAKLVPPGTR